MGDRRKTVPDLSLGVIVEAAPDSSSAQASVPGADSESIADQAPDFRSADHQNAVVAEGERVTPNRENAVIKPVSGRQKSSTSTSFKPKIETSLAAKVLLGPKYDNPISAGTSVVEEKRKLGNPPLVGLLEAADPLPQRPKTTSPVSQSTRNPGLASEHKPGPQMTDDPAKGPEPRLAGSLASFIAIQGNDLLKSAPQPEHREPQGYITLESKPESIRSAAGRNRPPKPSEHGSKAEDDPVEPLEDSLKPPDDQLKRQDVPAGPGNESADLRRFALDFVRSEQSGNVAEQHRFYAESVHFYGEGYLSWAGVEAATRRYRHENQNRRFGATAPAVVKGPVDGGFYVVDQPVSWNRTDTPQPTGGRSTLRLRVISTGRGGWKITSIEEVGN